VSEPLALVVSAELVDAIAGRVAELLERDRPRQEPLSPWLDVEGACAYLGFGRDTLYKLTAAGAIPCRKKAGGQGLRFHREELDTWMEEQYPRVDRRG
jgi:excisionase family DNA binding protein